jgi:hypothetical protein
MVADQGSTIRVVIAFAIVLVLLMAVSVAVGSAQPDPGLHTWSCPVHAPGTTAPPFAHAGCG